MVFYALFLLELGVPMLQLSCISAVPAIRAELEVVTSNICCSCRLLFCAAVFSDQAINPSFLSDFFPLVFYIQLCHILCIQHTCEEPKSTGNMLKCTLSPFNLSFFFNSDFRSHFPVLICLWLIPSAWDRFFLIQIMVLLDVLSLLL